VGGFGDIVFGYADAEKERAEAPDLLLYGFLDESRLIDKAVDGRDLLFLGHKGSGKTAIAERARLLAESSATLFVTIEQLRHFSYADFKSASGGAESTRYPTTWAWLLLLTMMQSLERDEGGREHAGTYYHSVRKGIHGLGLMPIPSLDHLVTTASKRSFRLTIPKLIEYTIERTAAEQDLQMRQLAAVLQRAVEDFTASTRHVVFIDGLDDVVTQKDLQFQALAALIGEVDRLNNAFRVKQLRLKFVVLCRTDMFERLPGANTNKIRQDSSQTLEWYDDPRRPERTRLMRLVNVRSRVALRREVDVFEEFLPAKIGGRPIRQYLLDHTRHTPRDLLQLMRYLQAREPDSGVLTEDAVLSGLRDYSRRYFIQELRNELAGYLDDVQIDNAVALLTSLRKTTLPLSELEKKAAQLGYDALDVLALARALFDCGGIGTVEPGREGFSPRYTFKYRNPNAVLLPHETIRIHSGAWKGLNMAPTGRARQRRRRSGQRPT
jgi:hypothetical protein